MNSESLKNSAIRRLFKASTVVALTFTFCATAFADTGILVAGEEAREIYDLMPVPARATESTSKEKMQDSGERRKDYQGISCFERVDLNDPNVLSYSCHVFTPEDLER